MRKIKDTLFLGCFATVFLVYLFFAFIAIDTGLPMALTFNNFLLLLGVGMLIALTSLVFEIRSFPFPARVAIHFVLQLADLLILFHSTGMMNGKTTRHYFLLIVGYAIVYALVWLAIVGCKKLYAFIMNKYLEAHPKEADRKNSSPKSAQASKKSSVSGKKNAASKAEDSKKDGSSGYTPLYK
jgi:hypothetical protein